jgi:hypothetical protein
LFYFSRVLCGRSIESKVSKTYRKSNWTKINSDSYRVKGVGNEAH